MGRDVGARLLTVVQLGQVHGGLKEGDAMDAFVIMGGSGIFCTCTDILNLFIHIVIVIINFFATV